jgi:hypothetical protein
MPHDEAPALPRTAGSCAPAETHGIMRPYHAQPSSGARIVNVSVAARQRVLASFVEARNCPRRKAVA